MSGQLLSRTDGQTGVVGDKGRPQSGGSVPLARMSGDTKNGRTKACRHVDAPFGRAGGTVDQLRVSEKVEASLRSKGPFGRGSKGRGYGIYWVRVEIRVVQK